MVDVTKDERTWDIDLPRRTNNECPFQFYPIDVVSCKVLYKMNKNDFPLCKYEICPYRVKDSLVGDRKECPNKPKEEVCFGCVDWKKGKCLAKD